MIRQYGDTAENDETEQPTSNSTAQLAPFASRDLEHDTKSDDFH
jgi:hypothetical protein